MHGKTLLTPKYYNKTDYSDIAERKNQRETDFRKTYTQKLVRKK